MVMPLRLLDVGSNDKHPFLFVTNGQRGSWATLSYCWGKGLPANLKTTESNLIERIKRVS
jgi:hypothetical protein